MPKLQADRVEPFFKEVVEEAYGPLARLLRGCRCVRPVCNNPGEIHHVRPRGAGGKEKKNIVPLCHECHMELHNLGRATWEERYGIDLGTIATIIYDVWVAVRGGVDDAGQTSNGAEK
jgi:hypothetical protein